MAHIIMHRHERRFPCHVKPTNQLVTDVWEACETIEIVTLALKDFFVPLAIIIGTTWAGQRMNHMNCQYYHL
jgi:hypothetical protein